MNIISGKSSVSRYAGIQEKWWNYKSAVSKWIFIKLWSQKKPNNLTNDQLRVYVSLLCSYNNVTVTACYTERGFIILTSYISSWLSTMRLKKNHALFCKIQLFAPTRIAQNILHIAFDNILEDEINIKLLKTGKLHGWISWGVKVIAMMFHIWADTSI